MPDSRSEKGDTKKLEGRKLVEWLAQMEGDWRHVPSPENLFILQRLDAAPLRGATGQVSLSGEILKQGELSDIINLIANSRWSGNLSLICDEFIKSITFREGDVTGATSNAAEDRLGDLAVRLGMVERDQLEEVLADENVDLRIGTQLIQKNLISRHDLYSLIQRQMEEVFFSLLVISKGQFYFLKEESNRDSTLPFAIPTQNLLMSGFQRIDEMSYFREKIPSSAVVFERLVPCETPPPVSKAEASFLERIDGQSDLDTLSKALHLSEFEATKTAFQLMQARFIRPITVDSLGMEGRRAKQGGANEVISLFNGVFASLYEEAKTNGRDEDLRAAVDSFFEANESYRLLFENVCLNEDGTLPADRLLENVSRLEGEDDVEQLYQGLNEFLFFQTFIAGETLDATMEERLHERLDELLQLGNAVDEITDSGLTPGSSSSSSIPPLF